MPAHESNPTLETRVGVITLSIIFSLSLLLIVLCNVQWGEMNTYRLAFKVSQDATGIEPGTPIMLGGIQWGKVLKVNRAQVPALGEMQAALQDPQASHGTLIEFEINPNIDLWPGAKITRTSSMLGGDVRLVILETGLLTGNNAELPMKPRDVLPQGAVINAVSANSGMASLLGSHAAARLDAMPEQFRQIYDAWKIINADFNLRMQPLGTTAKLIKATLSTDVDAWRIPMRTARQALARLQTHFSSESGVQTRVGTTWNEGKPIFDSTFADLKLLKQRIDQDFNPRMDRLSTQTVTQWKRTLHIASQLSGAGVDSIEAYRAFMADSSLMGGQISRSLNDILGSVLKAFLGKPNEDGMTRLRRFEAASRVAIATDEMRHANDALESLANSMQPIDPVLAQKIRADAATALVQFREAIEQLLKLSQQPL